MKPSTRSSDLTPEEKQKLLDRIQSSPAYRKAYEDPEFMQRRELRPIRLQLELQMKNLQSYRQAVGDRIDVIVMSGTDFGSQNGPFISPDAYREMFKPLHAVMNGWVHEHTGWKTFFHTCGSIVAYMDDFAEAGVDILNPVHITATGTHALFA